MNKYVVEASVNVHCMESCVPDDLGRRSSVRSIVIGMRSPSGGVDTLGDSRLVDEVSGDVSVGSSCPGTGVSASKALEGADWELVTSDEGASSSSMDSGLFNLSPYVGEVGKPGLGNEWEFVVENSRSQHLKDLESSVKNLENSASGSVTEDCGKEVAINKDYAVAVPVHQESTGMSDWEIVATSVGGAGKEESPADVPLLLKDSAEVLPKAEIIEDISIDSSSPCFEAETTLISNRSVGETVFDSQDQILPVVAGNVNTETDAVTVVGPALDNVVAQIDTKEVEAEPITLWNLKYFKKRPLAVVPSIKTHGARHLKDKHHKVVGLPWPPTPITSPCEEETVDSPHLEGAAPSECELTEYPALPLSSGLNETTSGAENLTEVESETDQTAAVNIQSGEEMISEESEPVFSSSDKETILFSGERKDMASVIQSLENGSSGVFCGLLLESGDESAAAPSA